LKYLLDTDVISQATKAKPHTEVLTWLRDRQDSELWLSAITIEELRFGLELLPKGKRRRELESWLEDRILHRFAGRILPVEERVADKCGRLFAAAKLAGDNLDMGDVFIAATASVHDLKIATLNRKHFDGLGVELVKF
jgi:predicted nucleic acid-binding protein